MVLHAAGRLGQAPRERQSTWWPSWQSACEPALSTVPAEQLVKIMWEVRWAPLPACLPLPAYQQACSPLCMARCMHAAVCLPHCVRCALPCGVVSHGTVQPCVGHARFMRGMAVGTTCPQRSSCPAA
jgi:hypothetical protein